MAKKKLNVSMPEELITQLDEFAKRNYMSRSAALTAAILKLLETQKPNPPLGQSQQD